MNETLELLEFEAQTPIAHRRDLHDLIDGLYLAAPLNEKIALLDSYETRERAVSSERRHLHIQIDALRLELGLPHWKKARAINWVPGTPVVGQLVTPDVAVPA